jgi:hypothetical protein
VICAVLELLNAGWRQIRGRKPEAPPPVIPGPTEVGDKS